MQNSEGSASRLTWNSKYYAVPAGSAGAYSGVSLDLKYTAMCAAPPSTKEKFAKSVKAIKYLQNGHLFLVERTDRWYIRILFAEPAEFAVPALDYSHCGPFFDVIEAVRAAELYRLSGPYDVTHDVDLAWNEIVWNLFHNGCDSIEEVVYEKTDWDVSPWFVQTEKLSDEPPEELMSFLDSITNETEGEANG